MRTSWADLPETIRAGLEDHLGEVVDAADVGEGQNSDACAVLTTADGEAFVKAVHGFKIQTRWLRNELAAATLTGGFAPRVLAHTEADGWLAVAFERVPGRAADLASGSPDLAVVADVAMMIGMLPATGLRPLTARWETTGWWARLAEASPEAVDGWDVPMLEELAGRLPGLVDGDRLVHTDLHGQQVRIDDATNQVRVVDWGMPGAGPAWVDPAFLVLRLVEAGHTPAAAEDWARRSIPAYNDATDQALDAFAAYLAGMWSCWAVAPHPAPGAAHRARLARGYAAGRLALVGTTRGA
ncbi:phosphotransferase [Actinosynnema sp. NPDC023587]|uniref:phosphotransferase n=1 Tax=Actinosynnema sp. NPDC023587 TaxID=3154695 RepID=UPI003407802F